MFRVLIASCLAVAAGAGSASASSVYWSLFNIEGESALTAQYVTYGTLDDMLADTNRLGVFAPSGGGAGANVVGSGSDGRTTWSLFNIEGESTLTAQYATYAGLDDMLDDTNRLGVFSPTGGGAEVNIVGSGSDGATYWSLFNIESESVLTAQYATYSALDDMLNDTNRLGVFAPSGGGAGGNVVGSGSDGSLYWSLFNIEGESTLTAQYVTYATLGDMLADSNRLGVFSPTGGGAEMNIVGSGAFVVPPIPLPATLPLLSGALLLVGAMRRRTVRPA